MDSAAELVRKLQIKPGSLVVAISGGHDFLTAIRDVLPVGASLATELNADARPNIILVWLTGEQDPNQVFQRLRQSIPPDGAIWTVIPRKAMSRKAVAAVTFDQVQAAALRTDLVDNKIASFSDKEYGIRFVIRREKRMEHAI